MATEDGELALTARHAPVEDLVALPREQQARKADAVAPAPAIRAEGGLIMLGQTVPLLGEQGVTMTAGAYRPTDVRDGGTGMARAWLSDGYKAIDHLDTLMAVFDGIRAAGHPVTAGSCDLTGRRMHARARCEAVQVLAPALLPGYRSPFTGARGADNPVVSAGFVVANSETGCGAATVTPRLVAQVIANGMTVTRDAVAAFLSPGYAERVVRDLERQAGHQVANAAKTVEVVREETRALASAAEHAGLPAGDARCTIHSGMTAGSHHPRSTSVLLRRGQRRNPTPHVPLSATTERKLT